MNLKIHITKANLENNDNLYEMSRIDRSIDTEK